MAQNAGTLAVALTANSTPFERTLYKARRQVKDFAGTVKTAMASVGVAVGAGALIGGFKSLTSEMDAIGKRSGVLNISAERYQQFAYAARHTGTEIGVVESAMKRMDMTLGKAVSGEKSAIDAFRALGLEVSDIRKLKPDELFDLVAKSIGEIADPAEKSAAQIGIFGKNGAELNNFLRDYLKLGEEAKASGMLFKNEDVKAAEGLVDAFTDLNTSIKVLVADSGLTKWLRAVAEGILAVKNLGAEASGFTDGIKRELVRMGVNILPGTTIARMLGYDIGEMVADKVMGNAADNVPGVAAPTVAEVANANQARQTRIAERAEREAKRAAYLAERAAVKPEVEKAVKAEKVKEAASGAAGDFSIAALARSLVGGNAPMERTADATEALLEQSREQTQLQRKAAENNDMFENIGLVYG